MVDRRQRNKTHDKVKHVQMRVHPRHRGVSIDVCASAWRDVRNNARSQPCASPSRGLARGAPNDLNGLCTAKGSESAGSSGVNTVIKRRHPRSRSRHLTAAIATRPINMLTDTNGIVCATIGAKVACSSKHEHKSCASSLGHHQWR